MIIEYVESEHDIKSIANNQYPESNIEYPASSIEHPASSISASGTDR